MRGRMPRAIEIPTFLRTITVTGNGGGYCSLTIDGTAVSSAGVYEVKKGEVIGCYLGAANNNTKLTVTVNGETVLDTIHVTSATYDYVVTKNATINLDGAYTSKKTITITEG